MYVWCVGVKCVCVWGGGGRVGVTQTVREETPNGEMGRQIEGWGGWGGRQKEQRDRDRHRERHLC